MRHDEQDRPLGVPASDGYHLVDDIASQLFKELILWETQLALMFLGKVPNPQMGQSQTDLDQAQIAIGILEMLQWKTRGNLSCDEDQLLRECLAQVRRAFVETLNREEASGSDSAQI